MKGTVDVKQYIKIKIDSPTRDNTLKVEVGCRLDEVKGSKSTSSMENRGQVNKQANIKRASAHTS